MSENKIKQQNLLHLPMIGKDTPQPISEDAIVCGVIVTFQSANENKPPISRHRLQNLKSK